MASELSCRGDVKGQTARIEVGVIEVPGLQDIALPDNLLGAALPGRCVSDVSFDGGCSDLVPGDFQRGQIVAEGATQKEQEFPAPAGTNRVFLDDSLKLLGFIDVLRRGNDSKERIVLEKDCGLVIYCCINLRTNDGNSDVLELILVPVGVSLPGTLMLGTPVVLPEIGFKKSL